LVGDAVGELVGDTVGEFVGDGEGAAVLTVAVASDLPSLHDINVVSFTLSSYQESNRDIASVAAE
jgi:hypothetical protein